MRIATLMVARLTAIGFLLSLAMLGFTVAVGAMVDAVVPVVVGVAVVGMAVEFAFASKHPLFDSGFACKTGGEKKWEKKKIFKKRKLDLGKQTNNKNSLCVTFTMLCSQITNLPPKQKNNNDNSKTT